MAYNNLDKHTLPPAKKVKKRKKQKTKNKRRSNNIDIV